MSFIGATGLDEVQEQFDILKDEIDANASYINTLVGIPDPTHLPFFGVNILNPGLYGLVERAEVNIKALQTQQGTSSTAISGIETSITGIEASITGIGGQITAVEGSISTIQFVELPLLSASIVTAGGVAADALVKANRSLGIWDESGNNVYHKKSGNVGIGTTFGSVLNNKLEVNGNINIPTGSTFRINNEPFNYSHLAGTQPISSKWTNATDTSTNIFYNTGNVGIGKTTAIINRLEVGGNLNISTGSKYKIGDVNLAFSDLAGTLSYNSLTDKLTQGTNITITGNVINNTYSLPTAGVGTGGTLGGVKVDGTTITITNQVISAVAGAQQVNSDWTQTNSSLKSFIQNKPTAGANISFANNQISLTDFVGIGTTPPSGNTKLDVNGNINSTGLRINNLAIGSDPTQNIINLSGNKLLINDKPDTERIAETFTTHTSLSEPSVSPNIIVADAYYPRVPATNSLTWTDNGKTIVCKVSDPVFDTGYLYKLFNHIITSQDHYHSQAIYTGTGNTYAGATRFKTFAGIAISIDFGRSIYPERMRIAPRPLQAGFTGNAFILGAPKAFKIFASDDASCWNDNNHSSWTQIHDQTTSLSYVNEQYTIVNFTANLPKYRYYTMVVLSTIGNYAGGYMIFSEWNVGGDEKIDAIPEYNSGSLTHKTLTFTFNKENIQAYYKFNNSTSLGLDSNPSTTKYNLTPTIIGGTGGYNTAINIEGASFQATNDGDYLEGDFPLKSMFDSSTTGISISFWVYKKLATYGNPYNTSIFHFYHPTISTLDISMSLGHFNAIYKTNFSIQYGAGGEIYSSGFGNVLAFDTWYHYVLVITKTGNIKVYFNGVNLNLVTGTTDATIRTYGGSVYPLPTSSFPNTTKLKIFNPTAPAGFSGNIDEFYVFNKELTQDDITLLYNKTYTLPINQYSLSVSSDTSISINSGTFQYLSGNYTISVGATQSSVVIAGGISQAGQTDPYPLQNGSTIAIRYYMLRRTISVDYYKKSGFIKYVPSLVGGEFPDTGSWQIVDIDNQALGEFAGTISFDRVIGNLPLDKLQNLDMSKITTGNLPFSRIDGNLAASRLDLSSGITLPADITAITSGGNGRVYYINNGASIYSGYGTGDIIQFRNADNTTLLSVNSDTSVRSAAFIATACFARGGGYDIRIASFSSGMYIEMGTEASFNAAYLRIGAYNSGNFFESNSNRNILFDIYSGIASGTRRQWEFNINGGSYNHLNTTTWNQQSDHRIKENIVKADLKKCYDNVKNINLYRFNYIETFNTSKQDKNKLGYIAQEVKKHFPKAINIKKVRLSDNREIPDTLSIDVEQINLSLYGAVKQLIKIVEKQNKRIKTLETLLNIEVSDDIENDAGEAYEKIIYEEEINIDDIEPTEPSTEV
jgi:hypothetical protein